MTAHPHPPHHPRVAAELAVARGDIYGAAYLVEVALRDATPERRVDLEQARSWIDELLPQRDSSIAIG